MYIYEKIENVANHQPVFYTWCRHHVPGAASATPVASFNGFRRSRHGAAAADSLTNTWIIMELIVKNSLVMFSC